MTFLHLFLQLYFENDYHNVQWTSLSHVGFEVLTAVVMKSTIFWDITLCSLLNVNRRFRGIYHLHFQGRRISQTRNQHEALLATCFTLVSCLAYSWTLKMEVICSSETSVDIQWTTWRYIPEGSTLQAYPIFHNICVKSESFFVRKIPKY
jgi:hypothetical protein